MSRNTANLGKMVFRRPTSVEQGEPQSTEQHFGFLGGRQIKQFPETLAHYTEPLLTSAQRPLLKSHLRNTIFPRFSVFFEIFRCLFF